MLGIKNGRRPQLDNTDARTIVAAVARELVHSGQIEPVGAPTILATLMAHHVLELTDYPQVVFRFEHQQLQEYCAAFDIRTRLLDLRDDAIYRFTADYVNDPAWAEPLRRHCQVAVATGKVGR